MSDCRMSGTAFGTIVLHITPEAAAGGPLALVESGDRIRLSVHERSLDLLVDDAVLARRRAVWRAPATPARGWDRIVAEQVLQADEGAIWRCCAPQGERRSSSRDAARPHCAWRVRSLLMNSSVEQSRRK